MIKINDKCRITSDWVDSTAKTRRVQVMRLQQNGGETFAKVMWIGKDARANEAKYGVLFPFTELKKI